MWKRVKEGKSVCVEERGSSRFMCGGARKGQVNVRGNEVVGEGVCVVWKESLCLSRVGIRNLRPLKIRVHPFLPFLGATKHLYNWLCPLVG